MNAAPEQVELNTIHRVTLPETGAPRTICEGRSINNYPPSHLGALFGGKEDVTCSDCLAVLPDLRKWKR